MESSQTLSFIHFNDVYELKGTNSPGLCGGADRFCSLVNTVKQKHNSMVVFSGDLWSPSKLSMAHRGQQMVLPLQHIGTAAACIGNHDLDLGEDRARELAQMSGVPWLLSNVRGKDGRMIAGSQKFVVQKAAGWTIGFVGIAAEDWLLVLPKVDPMDLVYEDPVACADRLALMLSSSNSNTQNLSTSATS